MFALHTTLRGGRSPIEVVKRKGIKGLRFQICDPLYSQITWCRICVTWAEDDGQK